MSCADLFRRAAIRVGADEQHTACANPLPGSPQGQRKAHHRARLAKPSGTWFCTSREPWAAS